ncbi:alpha-(1-_3)-arabinofuranosyltransferase domain-containing protein [Aeromicrobium choanae]|uniref:Arabinofuranan 3-O-arabinosyltransferase n=1 Tax=Aeromicrobium choanae TaxID=1736691 RepID=A0A1T4YPE2_9ACTN|nr:alpha-(1->3)-arabinofuranosyltransferase family protein [Aeromicrobium choanae]SKB03135.1 arabinofuranan 3-O-arabinosyltransferase [Aeromicrobium choanae]
MRLFTHYRFVVGSAILALALVIGLNGWGTFYTDIKPEVYVRPWQMLGQYLSSWTSSPYLGSPNFNVGLAPVLLVLSALRGIGLSPEMTFKVFHFVLWLVAAWGAARLTRTIAPQVGRWGGLLAAVLLLANPYTISAGATLAIALPMALLPWQLLCLIHGLRRPASWAWPALFGLTFFAMSGMNVAVVPLLQLLAVIPVVLAIRASDGLRWLDALLVLAKSALFVVVLSLYWLVPAFAALTTGAQIVEGSESLTGIAKVSSLTEVLRGLGLWPLYGSSSTGPWVPEHAVYVVSPLIMLLTAAWPALGLIALAWARTRARVFVSVAVFGAAIVMVGVFPSEDGPASPFGRLLGEILQIPALSAFRTTNKIGAVLAVAMTIGIVITVMHLGPRVWRWHPARTVVVVVAASIFAAWSLPALAGRLYISPIDIPDYWSEAAASVDESSQPGSVLVLPGQVRPFYRWTEERPDDVVNALFDRRAVVPETTPNASPPGVNFLAALDGSVQSGTSTGAAVSTMARYLGAGQVLLRNDVVWENTGGARPAEMNRLIANDPGLFGRQNFGVPGENTLSPAMEDPFFHGENLLPPVQVYDVGGARESLRAVPLDGQVIVAGDGFAFPALAEARLLDSSPLVRYAQDLSTDEFSSALDTAGRMVLTDTNARRSVIANRLTVGQGPLLREDQDPGATRTLGTDTDDQTVRVDSVVKVTTSRSGGTFFDLPYGTGDFAVDGDLTTGWRFGDFGTAAGQRLVATLDEPVELDEVPIAQLPIGDVQIDEVTVSAGGRSDTITLPETGLATARLGGVEADEVTVTIDSTRGEGFNFVGIAEIGLDGRKAHVAGRTPLTLSNTYDELDSSDRLRFSRTPLDVLLTRVQNTPSTSDDSERALNRVVTLPDRRAFETSAQVRVSGPVEVMYDRVEGRGKDVEAESSGFYFDNPANRASRAADGDADTGWVPGGTTRGAWWEIRGEPRRIDQMRLVQEAAEIADEQTRHHATRVTVSVDGVDVAESEIGLGETTIDLDRPVRGSAVRVTIDGIEGDPNGVPATFTTIDTGLEVPEADGGDHCLPVAVLDGEGLLMRPQTSLLARSDQQGTRWVGCEPTRLEAGEHTIDGNPAFVLDSLELSDTRESLERFGSPIISEITREGDARMTLDVEVADGPYAVVTGQSHNPNWSATADGKDLGAPVILDGFSSGWIVEDGAAATIDIRYTPQLWSNIALGASGLGLLAALALVVTALVRRRLFALPDGVAGPTGLRPRWATARVLTAVGVVGAGLLLGWGGLAGALVAAVLTWVRPVDPRRLVYAGSALTFLSVVALLVVQVRRDGIGELSADVISASLVPHHVAAAGLVLAIAGSLILLARRSDDD